MKINTQKIKYTIQAAIIVLVFVFMTSAAQASEITADNIIKYVNLARASQGLNELVPNAKLMQVAKDKLNDMIANQYFAHTSPEGVNPWAWFQREGYDYHFAGENLAINFTDAESQQSAWMASPTHRKNILDANYQEIGVAVGMEMINGQPSIIAVQEFGATFAGVPTGEKTFSPLKNSNLKTNDGQIIPQVLSVKNTTPDQVPSIKTGGMPQSGILNWFEKNKMGIIEQSFLWTIIIMGLSIISAAATILSVAIDKMWNVWEIVKRKKMESVV